MRDEARRHGRKPTKILRAGVAGLVLIGSIASGPSLAQETQPAPIAAPQSAPPALPGALPSPATDTSDAANPIPATNSLAVPVPASSAVVASSPSAAALRQNLSPWSMFMGADIVVKGVMVGLAFASLATWTVWLAKGLELFRAKRKARSAVRKLEEADSLAAAAHRIREGWTRRGPVADLVGAAAREQEHSTDLSAKGVKEHLSIALARIDARAGRAMTRAPACWPPSGPPPPSSACSARFWVS